MDCAFDVGVRVDVPLCPCACYLLEGCVYFIHSKAFLSLEIMAISTFKVLGSVSDTTYRYIPVSILKCGGH